MIYRIDRLTENSMNPITGHEYDNSWIILMLTDSLDYQQMCGSSNDCAYTIKMSRSQCRNWEMAVGDFIGFSEANEKNAILIMSEADLKSAKKHYEGHRYNEPFLRGDEPSILVHSTSMNSWEQMKRDGMLKSWNILKTEKPLRKNNLLEYSLVIPLIFVTTSCSVMALQGKLL